MSTEPKRRSVLAAVLHPATPKLQPRSAPAATTMPPDHNPETGEINPMSRPIRPLAGFAPAESPFTPADPVAAGADRGPLDPRERPAPGEPIHADTPPLPQDIIAHPSSLIPHPSVSFSITPTLGAVAHSGAILDRLRGHVHQLGIQAKVTFHF